MWKSLKHYIKQFFPSSSYQSLNTIEINSSHIVHNFQTLQKIQPTHVIIPVVKSNAYGHGLREISRILHTISDKQLPLIALDSYPEYQIVHDTTSKDILVLGETWAENYHLYNPHRTHIAVGSIRVLQSLIATKKKWNIHIFLNTGMNREGFQEQELQSALQLFSHNIQITVIGVMSHLANSDGVDNTFTDKQIEKFKQLYTLIQQYDHKPVYIHISNSAGISKINDPLFTASRSGLAVYGYNPLNTSDPHHDSYKSLKPSLRIISTITTLQKLQKGDSVNYGLTRTADKKTTIATLPFGYYEGLPRLSGTGYNFYHNQIPVPIRGRVCMNLSSCEIKSLDVQIGDQIEIIGRDKNKNNTIEQLAKINNTIPYTILTSLNNKLKRVIV